MDERLSAMRDSLQDCLDELSSTRSSSEAKTLALHRIERHLAVALVPKDSSESLSHFNALQWTFECNAERELQASTLSSQLSLSLSLIQGVSLNHSGSKTYMGRKYALEVLIDLLLASRHLPSTETSSRTQTAGQPPLSSVVLDTLLCVLVDSPAALRVFEEASGNQAVVKILKRAGTPREVRMKCLEFLYFYLLDENTSSSEGLELSTSVPTPPPTAPATPVKSSKPFLNSKPLRPSSSRLGSSEFSFPSNKASSSSTHNTPRSTSGSSTQSYSSTSSNVSGSTAPTSTASSPSKSTSRLPQKTPPTSPRTTPRVPQQLQSRSLMMLRREVDYEPQSPKKLPMSRSGIPSRHNSSKSMSRSRLGSSEDDCRRYDQMPGTPSRNDQKVVAVDNGLSMSHNRSARTRTTEEKKELLGTMLGNVDALVEGVRKAGIWGLG
ncbi:hypothetical protein H0H92_015266 [Tricholoma furcatifolium]|nr:hypothetical protein H0H92_015266 [Tricholoma furcatifolium]